MKFNVEAIIGLAEERKWSMPELAKRLGINYSHLFRVLNKEKGGGAKLFAGILRLCKKEGLNIESFIFLEEPLSVDNNNARHNSNLPGTGNGLV